MLTGQAVTEGDDEKELTAFLTRAVAEFRRQKDAERAKPIRDLWVSFLASMEGKSRYAHLCSTTRYLSIDCPLGDATFKVLDLPWSDFDTDHFEAWMKAMAVAPSRKGGQLLAKVSIDAHRFALQACFKHHVKVTKQIRFNPLKGMRKMDDHPPMREFYFTPDTLEVFCRYANPLLAALLRTSARCGGLRKDEVRTLTKGAINYEARELVVKNKGGRMKRVLIPDDTYEELRARARLAPGEFLFWNPRDPLGGPVPAGTIDSWFQEARRKAAKSRPELKDAVFHGTRHAFGIGMLAAGAPPGWVSQQMGHASTRELDTRYGRLRGPELERMRGWMNANPLGADKKSDK